MHFEDIWNDAENFSENIDDSLEEIISTINTKVSSLEELQNSPKEQALNIGDILFYLACICKKTEVETGQSVNIAAGMKEAVESRKQSILDPDEK